MNEKLYEKAKEAIMELFNDTSVGARTALQNMKGLIDEIELLVDGLEMDIANEDEEL